MIASDRMNARVGHDDRLVLVDCVLAEGNVAAGLDRTLPDAGFEPLPLGLDKGEVNGGNLEKRGGEAGDPVEAFLGRGIEKIQRAQVGQTQRFSERIDRKRRRFRPGKVEYGGHP
jgi:hypothetical protein